VAAGAAAAGAAAGLAAAVAGVVVVLHKTKMYYGTAFEFYYLGRESGNITNI